MDKVLKTLADMVKDLSPLGRVVMSGATVVGVIVGVSTLAESLAPLIGWAVLFLVGQSVMSRVLDMVWA